MAYRSQQELKNSTFLEIEITNKSNNNYEESEIAALQSAVC